MDGSIRPAQFQVKPVPRWAKDGRPVNGRDRLMVESMSDAALRTLLERAGCSPFVARVTVEDRRTVGATYRIVHELRGLAHGQAAEG